MSAKVYLIGAGPGDVSLITLKAVEILKKADVVIYDYLANEKLLKFAPKIAERIYVGKKYSQHTLEQNQINQLIVEKAKDKKNKIIARLKGGDPFVFGRGAEEALELNRSGIEFEIIPGITSGVAAPMYAGIPVTHRDFASTVTFITGNEAVTKEKSVINWQALVNTGGTLVFYMGMRNLSEITKNLIANGMNADMPCAVVQWGTTSKQRTVTADLSTIVSVVEKEKISFPAIILVGNVVKIRDNLKWFENKPLFGKKVVVTRSREQISILVEKLENLGADVIEFPVIAIEIADNYKEIDFYIKKIQEYDWLVFTSANGVDYFFKRIFELGLDVRVLKDVKIAVIGPSTADKLKSYYINADKISTKYVAEQLLEEFSKEYDMKGKKILIPASNLSRDVLPEGLKKLGAEVYSINIYKTVPEKTEDINVLKTIQDGDIDIVTFTSSSTVKNFVEKMGENIKKLKKTKFVSIGPITSRTIKEFGLDVDIEASEYTIDGLIDAIIKQN